MPNSSFTGSISINNGNENSNGGNYDTVNINLTNNQDESDENATNNIYLPLQDFTYGSITDSNDSGTQYLVTSDSQPSTISNGEDNLVLKYIRNDNGGKIDWVKDLETLGDFPNKISDTISRTLPLGDFFTDIQSNVDNFNSSTNNLNSDGKSADTKYKWVNLSATVIDIGLNQLAWNTNKQYYHHENGIIGANSNLYIDCSNIDRKSVV